MSSAVLVPNVVSSNAMPPVRVGVLIADMGDFEVAPLKYVLVHLNTLQRVFEFEVLPTDYRDPVILMLRRGAHADRDQVRDLLTDYRERTRNRLQELAITYRLSRTEPPERFVLITLATLSDEYYTVATNDVRVQALGNWDADMAPPSLLEAVVTLTLRGACGFLSPELSRSVHLGTKGCLFDFTPSLDEGRFRTLHGFICSGCHAALAQVGREADVITIAAASDTCKWIGTIDEPYSPASIISKLGYNLFLTKGISPTWWERLQSTLKDDGIKEAIKLLSGVVLAALLLWLGLKK